MRNPAKKPCDVREILTRFEEKIKRYEQYSNKEIDEDDKKGMLSNMLDDESRKHMVNHMADGVSYETYKTQLLSYINTVSNKMDIGSFGQAPYDEHAHTQYQGSYEQYQNAQVFDNSLVQPLDAIKGKGKGFVDHAQRQCYNCNDDGHISNQCPKGKGKGKKGKGVKGYGDKGSNGN